MAIMGMNGQLGRQVRHLACGSRASGRILVFPRSESRPREGQLGPEAVKPIHDGGGSEDGKKGPAGREHPRAMELPRPPLARQARVRLDLGLGAVRIPLESDWSTELTATESPNMAIHEHHGHRGEDVAQWSRTPGAAASAWHPPVRPAFLCPPNGTALPKHLHCAPIIAMRLPPFREWISPSYGGVDRGSATPPPRINRNRRGVLHISGLGPIARSLPCSTIHICTARFRWPAGAFLFLEWKKRRSGALRIRPDAGNPRDCGPIGRGGMGDPQFEAGNCSPPIGHAPVGRREMRILGSSSVMNGSVHGRQMPSNLPHLRCILR